MRTFFYTATIFLVSSAGISVRSQQINISRVEIMPYLPTPYLLRDWTGVARKYDSLIYNVNHVGLNWPLVKLGDSGINYPEIKPIFMDSYVGSASHGTQAEAINILPSLVGATLVGIDKSKQFGVNWVESAKDFFNKHNGQNVYLNGTSTHSGNDGWYDIMPNVFFYQLYSLYPNTSDFNLQFVSVADVWLNAVYKMGGSVTPWKIPDMNFRAWNLSTNSPLTTGVIEPESAGSLSWLMYSAYLRLGDKKYLYAAQMCMDFLNGLNTNPSYEIQLPYGALTAARMNAELGSNYDLDKSLNWVFNRGPLRGWGTIAGTWDSVDVSGLVGEANDAGDDYAFVMNGFQQAATLLPLVKYDKRYARAIAKWILNLANASRFFYTQYLPEDHQDSYAWSIQNDSNSVIAHESLKQTWNGIALFARGDAIQGGWASTNLSLYSSSHVGYLGAILNKTNEEGILSLDLNKTDFFGDKAFPQQLIYNPYNTAKNIEINLGSGTYDIYDAITEKVIQSGATGIYAESIGADSTQILVCLPPGSSLTEMNGKLYAGQHIVDYHYHYNFTGQFRIKSLAPQKSQILVNTADTVYCTVDNPASSTRYSWSVNGVEMLTDTINEFNWRSPDSTGFFNISCTVTSGEFTATDTVFIRVDSLIPVRPQIIALNSDKKFYFTNDTAMVTCQATDENSNDLIYTWSGDHGEFQEPNGSSVKWLAPSDAGIFILNCHIENSYGLYSDTTLNVLVKSPSIPEATPLIYYPFDGDVKDYSGNGFDAVLSGASLTTDALGINNRAYRFSSPNDLIRTPNQPALNFQNKITIGFWVKLDQVPEESYILSHGSWEERYKISVTPGRKLRWTLKTDQITKDLDSSVPLDLNTFYHFTVAYTGYSMETYINGDLDVFSPITGLIQQTDKDITIGHKDVNTNSYFLRGTVDEIRIYNDELPVSQIESLPTLWNRYTGLNPFSDKPDMIYPNPANQFVFIKTGGSEPSVSVTAYDITGRILPVNKIQINPSMIRIELIQHYSGLALIKLQYPKSQVTSKILFQ